MEFDDSNLNFREIERRLRTQSEQYRDRHISAKHSLYAAIIAFNGLAIAAAGTISASEGARWPAICVVGLAILSCLIVFKQYDWILDLYDKIGFTKISIRNADDIAAYEATNKQILLAFSRRKQLRRFLDYALWVITIAQAVLILLGLVCRQ